MERNKGKLKDKLKSGGIQHHHFRSAIDFEQYKKELDEILDEAKDDIVSEIHDYCHWNGIEECLQMEGYPYYYVHRDKCPLRKIEKWFGELEHL